MLRSLYAGISGLRAEQTMLDVTSNNIANVNTVGFKSSAVHFEDTLSQTLQAAGLPQSYKAGTNPDQVGLGVRVGDIATSTTQGSTQTTGNNLDAMISGDGFFVTKTGSQQAYTRNGEFHLDAQGRLATSDGAFVQGWTASANGNIATGTAPGQLTISPTAVKSATQTTAATMTGNLPSDTATAEAFSRDIPVYSKDGTQKTLTVSFTPSGKADGTWNYTASDENGSVTGTLVATDGKLQQTPANTSVDGISLDLSAMTGYSGLNTVTLPTQNGFAAGTLTSYKLGGDGTITGTFSNGQTQALGRIALATFTNPAGLEKSGDTAFTESLNSGRPDYGSAGSDGFGTVAAGALEMSNVDLSQEFTNLIVAQRGFQANARIITTSDEVLQDLVQLKH